jgi:CHAT domain-containing protein
MLERHLKRFFAALLLLCLLAQPAFAASSAPPVGPDVEDYQPPYSEGTQNAAWRSAFLSGDLETAERVARAMLATALRGTRRNGFAELEARFMLGLTLDARGRKTEAEGEYRDGLAWLARQIGSDIKTEADGLASEWARYFEIHLRDNLRAQGRVREATEYQSILPPPPRLASGDSPEAEVAGVGSIAGVATNLDLGTNSMVRLDDAQMAQRQRLMAQARTTAQAGDRLGYYQAWTALLAFDEPRHGATGEQTAYDLRRVAEAALDLGNHAEAQLLAARAVRILEITDDSPHQLAAALSVQAKAIQAVGDAVAAEPLLRRALALRYQGSNPWLQLDLAANLFAQHRLAESETLYRQSLTVSGLPLATRNEVQIFAGYLARQQGENARGMADYRAVCAVLAEQVAQMSRGSRASFSALQSRDAARDCAVRQTLAAWDWAQLGGGEALSDRPPMLRDEAFMAAQTAHIDPSAAALARAGAKVVAGRSGVGTLVSKYEQAIEQRDKLGAAPPEDWINALYEALPPEQEVRIEQLNADIARLAGSLAKAAPRYWDLRSPQPLGILALQAKSGADAVLLRRDEALISFMIPADHRRGIVFAVTKDGVSWAMLPFERAELVEMVNRLRAQIDPKAYGVAGQQADTGIGQLGFDRMLAWKLYRGLFGDPAIQSVIAAKPNWIIVPAGPLTTLPPGLLLTAPPEGGTDSDDDLEALRRSPWLIRSKALTLLPSVASLRTVRQILPKDKKATSEPLLALVDPDSSDGSPLPADPRLASRSFVSAFRGNLPDVALLRSLPRLAHALEEGIALKAVLRAPAGSVLSGQAASKAGLMARNTSGALARVRVLEFATHGFAAGQGDGSAEPMLVLSAATRPEDWVLRASDAAGLDLNADWVVLSGCNTASPDAGTADGLSGFARAFFFAGASSLLVSHWRLDDEIAARLVPATFRFQRRNPGKSKAQALRHAMLDILDDPNLDAAHPAFWAPLTLIGESG